MYLKHCSAAHRRLLLYSRLDSSKQACYCDILNKVNTRRDNQIHEVTCALSEVTANSTGSVDSLDLSLRARISSAKEFLNRQSLPAQARAIIL